MSIKGKKVLQNGNNVITENQEVEKAIIKQ